MLQLLKCIQESLEPFAGSHRGNPHLRFEVWSSLFVIGYDTRGLFGPRNRFGSRASDYASEERIVEYVGIRYG